MTERTTSMMGCLARHADQKKSTSWHHDVTSDVIRRRVNSNDLPCDGSSDDDGGEHANQAPSELMAVLGRPRCASAPGSGLRVRAGF